MSFPGWTGLWAGFLLAGALAAQQPLNVLSIEGNGSTFSLDPSDPSPVRSLWAVFEVDRRVQASEILVVQEAASALNARPVSARYFQRATDRGTQTVWIEVMARPTVPGKPARIGFQVRLAGSLAGTIETATPLQRGKGNPLFYAEPDACRSGFYLVYPRGARFTAMAQSANPLTGQPWEEHQVVYPDDIDGYRGRNLRAHYGLPLKQGLVNVYAPLADGSSYAQVVYVNLAVRREEWIPLPIVSE